MTIPAEAVAQIAAQLQISQSEAARLAGVTYRTWRRWCTGVHPVDMDRIDLLKLRAQDRDKRKRPRS